MHLLPLHNEAIRNLLGFFLLISTVLNAYPHEPVPHEPNQSQVVIDNTKILENTFVKITVGSGKLTEDHYFGPLRTEHKSTLKFANDSFYSETLVVLRPQWEIILRKKLANMVMLYGEIISYDFEQTRILVLFHNKDKDGNPFTHPVSYDWITGPLHASLHPQVPSSHLGSA